ncbi:THUMP-like domain-containing protein [Allokutzneria albata]|uniref:THUMP-like domain-containing protein n=1 Tax=Allokutzneria albata TaxID=211114 RepID=A0A1G9XLK0_ALLAB|nr:hypothetical protein [Allokutzneria albata]SDM97719.1 hypothetical protein SAMN04489726_4287 [Allokutzneria albata]
MGYAFTVEDVEFLRSPAGEEALRAAAELPLTPASRLGDVASVRRAAGERFAAAVLETAVLRRRTLSKLDGAASWLLTEDAAQQATASVVARHRAGRLEGRDVHDVTCSIGADLVEVAAVADLCIGSDVDDVRISMAKHNCEVAGATAGLLRADALRPVSRGTVVLADPARRDGTGRRKWRPEDLVPPLGDLMETYRGRDMAVKCAPGLDFAAVPWAGEVEIVSLAGQVREACVWVGATATFGVNRRATVLGPEGPLWTITDAESEACPVREVGEWIIDPDGAVVRAGLVRHYGARHGLGQLDPRIAYLTGDTPPRGVRAFRVLEHGKYNEKTLRALLREREVGRLEILVRGLDIDPDALRRRLKISGPGEATVVLTRVGDTPTAYLCRAERV